MKIDSASSSPSLAQRQLMTRTPDQDFQRDFQAAYARLAVAAEGSAEQAGALADTLGATQLEYSRVRGVSLEDQLRFAHVLNRACENGAQLDARGFLARLRADDLQALQRNMGLAEPIRVEALSEEGARNLLLPEGYSVDLDGDGITEVGAAKIRHFPRATHRRPSSTSGWRSPPAWTAPPIRTPATGCNGLSTSAPWPASPWPPTSWPATARRWTTTWACSPSTATPWFPASTNATYRCTRRCASAWPEVAYSLTSM